MASRGKRLLIGCGIGCGGLLLVAILVIVSFVIWLNRPGELLDPETLVGGDTSGHVAWTLRLEDPGTREFVEQALAAIRGIQERGRVDIHPAIDSWLSKWQQRRNEKQMQEMFPLVVAWTVRPGDQPRDDLHLFSISIESAGNRLVLGDWMMGWGMRMSGEVEVVSHQGEKIYRIPTRPGHYGAFFIRGNDILIASDVETAQQAVDRMVSTAAGQTTSQDFGGLYGLVPEEFALRGALSNRNGELKRVWKRLASATDAGGAAELPWPEVRGATLQGGFRNGRDFGLVLRFRFKDQVLAALNRTTVERMLRSMLPDGKLDYTLETTVEQDWVQADVEFTDIVSGLGRYLELPPGAPRFNVSDRDDRGTEN